LLSDLLSQILSSKHSEDKVLDNPIQVLEYKKSLTTRAKWQTRIPWATVVDPSTDFSSSCCGTSCKDSSTLEVATGLSGRSSVCLSEKYKDVSKA
jgi:hypothetical protein